MWKNRLALFTILFLIISLITAPLSYNPVDAVISVKEKKSPTDKRMDWEIIFIKSYGKCNERNWDTLRFYADISNEFLKKYQIDHALTGYDCVSIDDAPIAIQEAVNSSDLTIIIPDLLQSLIQRLRTNTAGHFEWIGNTKTILSQALTLKVEDKYSAWVLSHELSHFGLHWKGYPDDVKGDLVHLLQSMYDKCKKDDVSLAMCTEIWTTVQTRSGNNFIVMKPIYLEDYKELTPTPTPPTPTPTPVVPKPLPKISDCDVLYCYGNQVQALVGASYSVNGIKNYNSNLKEGDELCLDYSLNYYSKDMNSAYSIPYEKIKLKITTLDEKGNPISESVLQYHTLNQSGEIEICGKLKMYSPSHASNGYKYQVYFDGSSKYRENNGPVFTFYFSKPLPKSDPIIISPEPPTKSPELYTDVERGPSQLDTINEQLRLYDEKQQILKNKIEQMKLKLSQIEKTHNVKLGLTLSKLNDMVEYEPNEEMYELTQLLIERGYSSQAYKDIVKENQKLDNLIRGVDRLEADLIKKYADADVIKPTKVKESQNMEIQTLRNQFLHVINDLEKGVEISEKSLTGLTFQKKEAQEKINTAWDHLKENKKRLDAFDNYYLKNIDQASKSNYLEGVDRNVDSGMESARKAGENLVKISELIEEAKQLEKQKFCFLWWCW